MEEAAEANHSLHFIPSKTKQINLLSFFFNEEKWSSWLCFAELNKKVL